MFGSHRMGIGLTVTLRNNFSAPANSVAQSMANLTNRMTAMTNRQAMAASIGGGMLMGGGMVGLRHMKQAVDVAAEFERTMSGVYASARDNLIEAKIMENKALKLGEESIYTATNIASAMKFMAMAGFDRSQIMGAIDAVTALGGATDTALEGKGGAADIITNVMAAYKIGADQSMRTADILATAVVKSNTNLMDLGEAIKYSASTAMDLNYQIEDVVAGIMSLGNAGIQASMAGTAMENMMRYVTTASSMFATKKDLTALGMLGLTPADLKDAHGNVKPIINILELLKEKMGGLGSSDKQTLLEQIFGVRGKRAGSLLIRNLEEYRKFLAELKGVEQGAAMKMAKERMKNLYGAIEELSGSWQTFQVRMTQAIRPILIWGLKAAKSLVKFFTMIITSPIGKPLIIIASALMVTATILGGILFIMGSISFMINQISMANAILFPTQVAGWGASTIAARSYLATLWAIATAGRMNIAGSIIGPGGRIIRNASKVTWLERSVLWLGTMARSLGRTLWGLWGAFTRLSGIRWIGTAIQIGGAAMVGAIVFVGAALYAVGSWLYDYLYSPLKWVYDQIYDLMVTLGLATYDKPQRGGHREVSLAEYFNDPSRFTEAAIKARERETLIMGATAAGSKTYGATTLNVYVDGKKAISKAIEKDTEDTVVGNLVY